MVVKDTIGNFEFNAAPPSNFHPDGLMIMLSDKSRLVSSVLNISLPEGAFKYDPMKGAPSVLVMCPQFIITLIWL